MSASWNLADISEELATYLADGYTHHVRVSQGWLWIDNVRSNVRVEPRDAS